MAQSAQTRSFWMDVEVAPHASPLSGSLTCDTVIIGAGIAGLSAAYELAAAGQRVIVLDRGPIAGGMTARTTAHLSPICDDGMSALARMRGADGARQFVQSHASAIERIEAIVGDLGIDCDFRRLDGYLFAALDSPADQAARELDGEYDAAQKTGAEVGHAAGLPLGELERTVALRYARQATFHPLKYLRGLVSAVRAHRGRFFPHSAVVKIEENGDGVRITTAGDAIVTAAQVIVATNAPVNDRVAIHSKMAPYRTYAMAFDMADDALPDALYWDTADPYHYVRRQPGLDGRDVLIVGGEDHKSGEANDGDARFAALTRWIRRLVPTVGDELDRWSGQVMETMDYCGFIGRNPGDKRIFVACGDSGQGMTHGVLAGLILKDLIIAGESPWEAFYDPTRKPAAGIVKYVSENLTAVKSFVEYVLPGDVKSADDLRPGEGGILRDGTRLVAVCRDRQGVLHAHSASCTHLGCVVHWNPTEQCWDCPCHGSQFAADGSVLNAPATAPLVPARLPALAKP